MWYNKNMKKYKIGFYILLVLLLCSTYYVIRFSYALAEETNQIYSRDELSEIIQNHGVTLDDLNTIINQNDNPFVIYVNNSKVSSLSTSNRYYLDSYSCNSGSTTYTTGFVNWDSNTQKISINGNFSNNTNCTLNFYDTSQYQLSLAQKIYNDNQKIASRTNFTTAFSEETTGKIFYTSANTENVCKSSNNLTYVSGSGNSSICKTYYFAGNTTNNYVSFADNIWKIVRINEDESVRLLFDHKILNSSNLPVSLRGYINMPQSYSSCAGTNECLGYYNPQTITVTNYETATTNERSNAISWTIRQWVSNSSINDYLSYISKTAIYCNDRSIISGDGYGNAPTIYSGYNRIITNKSPQFKCTQTNDKFTWSTTSSNGIANYGNGKLSVGVALLTADELMYSGKIYNGGALNYMDSQYARWSSWYTMTPKDFNSYATVFTNSATNNGIAALVTNSYVGLRPALSLKSCVKYTKGNGTESSPYEVIIDNACASAIN